MKNPLYIQPILLASSASVPYSLSKYSRIPGGSMANMLFRMSSNVACALGLAVTLGGVSAKAGALFSTGNGDTTCGDLDANWTVQGTGLNGGVSEAATILNSSGCPAGGTANFFGSWAADTAASSWIGVQATNTGLPGVVVGVAPPYTFTLAFTLSSIPSSITGTWYIDDQGSLFANGTQIGIEETDTYTSGVAFSIPSADLVAGPNTIAVEMLSADGVDDGARVEFNPISTSGVPEPGSLFLCSAGAAAILFRTRQRLQRRKQ